MADEKAPEGESSESPDEGKKKKKKLLLFIIIGAVALVGIGAGAFLFLRHPSGEHAEGKEQHEGKEGGEGEKEKKEGEGEKEKKEGKEKKEKKEGEGEHASKGEEGEKGKEGGGEEGEKEGGKEGGKKGGKKGEKEGKEGKEGKDKKDKKEAPVNNLDIGESYALKPFHLNLGNPLENRYMRLEIALEYKNGEEQKRELEARLPQLRDAVLSVASRKTREFLLGPDGKDQLRLEILNRINQYMDKKIDAVYITDILIE